MGRRLLRAVLVLALAAALPAVPLVSEESDKEEPPAKQIAGRWRITLEGLAIEHHEILASLAVDGDLLIGTLTVGRTTVNITSGKVVGLDFSFAFAHAGGEKFRMRGTAGPRGLAGTWEARNEKGKWRAGRIGG